MQMSELQYNQLWKVIDSDNTEYLELKDFRRVLEAYEMWNYEKSYKAAMEEIYGNAERIKEDSE